MTLVTNALQFVGVAVAYKCDNCLRDVSKVVRIYCPVCECDICVECFAEGSEFGTHKNIHDYRVIEPFDFPLFVDDWRADEEILLLEACEVNGLGNWVDIADYIGSKAPSDCEKHYFQVYIDSSDFPLPDSMLSCNELNVEKCAEADRKRKLELERMELQAGKEHLTSQPAVHEITGFMPLRNEFETEIDNEAEQNVKELVFYEDDNQAEIDLKIAILQSYNGSLDRRLERKRFAFDRNLIDFKKHLQAEKHRTKDDKEILNSIKSFARYLSPQDFDDFYIGLVYEHDLRCRIAQLQEYRKYGVETFEEANQFEKVRKINRDWIPASVPQLPIMVPLSDRPSFRSRKEELQFHPPAQRIVNVGRRVAQPLDLSSADGLDLLSQAERDICSLLRLVPKVYLSIKETLISEYNKHGYLKRAQARSIIKIDVNKTSRIYDFFVAAGWIKPQSTQEEK